MGLETPSLGIPRVIATIISVAFQTLGTIMTEVFNGGIQLLNSQGLAPNNAVGILFGLADATGVWLTRSANGTMTARGGDSVGAAASGAIFSAGQLSAFNAATVGAVGELRIGGTTQVTVGAAGGASALPATPTGYLLIFLANQQRAIPFYNP